MLRTLSMLFMVGVLSACSLSSVKSYVPFLGDSKTVINLDEDEIDQKSYASAYEATVATYKGRVTEQFNVDSFASGANDWYLGRILYPINQIKDKLYNGGHDSDIYAYYSGVVHAEALQQNFNRLNKACWSKIDQPSATQGIYDAMIDLRKNKVRSDDDEYIVKGTEQLLSLCPSK